VNFLEQKVVVATVDVDSDQNRPWRFECLAEHKTDLVRGMDHVATRAKRSRVLDDIIGLSPVRASLVAMNPTESMDTCIHPASSTSRSFP
jgi:hypothetical protein